MGCRIECGPKAGWPCDMDPIMALVAGKGLYVIEDCAQAHGARYKGRPNPSAISVPGHSARTKS